MINTGHTKWVDMGHSAGELEIIHKDTALPKKGVRVSSRENTVTTATDENEDFSEKEIEAISAV